ARRPVSLASPSSRTARFRRAARWRPTARRSQDLLGSRGPAEVVDERLAGFGIDVDDEPVGRERAEERGPGTPPVVDGALAAGREIKRPECAPPRPRERGEDEEELGNHTR